MSAVRSADSLVDLALGFYTSVSDVKYSLAPLNGLFCLFQISSGRRQSSYEAPAFR